MVKARIEPKLESPNKKRKSPVITFSLGGCEWTLTRSPDLTELGYTRPDTQSIVILEDVTDQTYAVTFYHELVHAILFTMGKSNHDEEFVDSFGQLLYQYVKTVKVK